jgi:hypothetical protein
MGNGAPQASFASGELTPALYGHVDLARYYTALKTCRNFIVMQTGGATNRPGTRFIAEVHDSAVKSRLIEFQFSTEQTYALELGDYIMRVIKDSGVVLSAGVPLEVATLYGEADLPLINHVQSADVMTLCHSKFPPQQLSRLSHTDWSFAAFNNVNGPFQELNLDKSKTISINGVSGTITIAASFSAFLIDHIGMMIRIEQPPDEWTQKWEVGKAVTLGQIYRAGNNYYKVETAGTTGTTRPSVLEGTETDGSPGVTWRYLHSGFGVARLTYWTSSHAVEATVLTRMPDMLAVTGTIHNITTIDNHLGNVRIGAATAAFIVGDIISISGGSAIGIDGTYVVTATDMVGGSYHFYVQNKMTVTYIGTEPISGITVRLGVSSASYKWAFEAWGEDKLYPRTVTYAQQRQIFAGSPSFPQVAWFSTSAAGYTDFMQSNPLLDDDAISIKLASTKANEIRHIVELSEIIFLTSNGPVMVKGGQDGIITPDKINPKQQGNSGVSATLAPVVCGDQALYVQAKGNQVRSIGYSFQNDALKGTDLTLFASHLFKKRKIVSWAFQEIPYSCVWVVMDDGALLGLTYLPEQEVVAWHRHDTDGFFESVCCVSESAEDAVYFIVRRVVNGVTKRYIERLASRNFATPVDAFFVDSGLTYRGAPATHISGLEHLEGKTVAILADGNVQTQRVVTGGAITLDSPCSVVHVGLPITADLETLELANAQQDTRSKEKLINHVSMIVEETRGLWVGGDANNLTEVKRDAYTQYTDSTLETSGLVDLRIQATWSKKGNILVRQVDPLPATILSITPEVTFGGA